MRRAKPRPGVATRKKRSSRGSSINSTKLNQKSKRRTTAFANNGSATTKLPLSGSEPVFSDDLYVNRVEKNSNNCYAYSRSILDHRMFSKLQPGNLSGGGGNRLGLSCKNITDMVLRDGNAYVEKPETPCRKDYYKIMSVLAPGADYHFYRQNKDLLVHGTSVASVAKKYGVPVAKVTKLPLSKRFLVKDANLWSHKRGLSTGPLLVDSNGKTISDPRRAARNYGDLNYTEYCQTFCVHKTKGQNYRNLVQSQFKLPQL